MQTEDVDFLANSYICRQMIWNLQSDEMVYEHSFSEEYKIFIIELSFFLWPMGQRGGLKV